MSQSTGCRCGEQNTAIPTLVATELPHAIRHGAILGALGQLPSGGELDLVAPHNPLPLLAQLEDVAPGAFDRTYLNEGPDAWTIRFTRR